MSFCFNLSIFEFVGVCPLSSAVLDHTYESRHPIVPAFFAKKNVCDLKLFLLIIRCVNCEQVIWLSKIKVVFVFHLFFRILFPHPHGPYRGRCDLPPFVFNIFSISCSHFSFNHKNISAADYIFPWLIFQFPEFSVNFPALGRLKIDYSFFKKFDYGNAAVQWLYFNLLAFWF